MKRNGGGGWATGNSACAAIVVAAATNDGENAPSAFRTAAAATTTNQQHNVSYSSFLSRSGIRQGSRRAATSSLRLKTVRFVLILFLCVLMPVCFLRRSPLSSSLRAKDSLMMIPAKFSKEDGKPVQSVLDDPSAARRRDADGVDKVDVQSTTAVDSSTSSPADAIPVPPFVIPLPVELRREISPFCRWCEVRHGVSLVVVRRSSSVSSSTEKDEEKVWMAIAPVHSFGASLRAAVAHRNETKSNHLWRLGAESHVSLQPAASSATTDDMRRDQQAADVLPVLHNDDDEVHVRFVSSATYLSRDVLAPPNPNDHHQNEGEGDDAEEKDRPTMIVTVDKLLPKSAERWRLVKQVGKEEANGENWLHRWSMKDSEKQLANREEFRLCEDSSEEEVERQSLEMQTSLLSPVFHLYAVASVYQPDADRWCVLSPAAQANYDSLFIPKLFVGVPSTKRPCALLALQRNVALLPLVSEPQRCPTSPISKDSGDAPSSPAYFPEGEGGSKEGPTTTVRISVVTTLPPLRTLRSKLDTTASSSSTLIEPYGPVLASMLRTANELNHELRVSSSSSSAAVSFWFTLCVEEARDIDYWKDLRLDQQNGHPFWRPSDGAEPNASPRENPSVELLIRSDCEAHPELHALTYRGLFAAAEEALQTTQHPQSNSQTMDYLLFFNADVFVDLRELLSVILTERQAVVHSLDSSEVSSPDVLVVGSRTNCPVQETSHILRARFLRDRNTTSLSIAPPRQCALFSDTAQDYFLVRVGAFCWRDHRKNQAASPEQEDGGGFLDIAAGRVVGADPWQASSYQRWQQQRLQSMSHHHNGGGDTSSNDGQQRGGGFHRKVHRVPPFVIGGVAFDNWLVSQMNTDDDETGANADLKQDLHNGKAGVSSRRATHFVIDASAAVTALHFGGTTKDSLMASHERPSSAFNSEVAHYSGGWRYGKLTNVRTVALRGAMAAAAISELHPQTLLGVSEEEVRRFARVRQLPPVVLHCRQGSAVVLSGEGDTGGHCPLPLLNRRQSGDAFDGPWRKAD